jgi:hypothetical protein
MMASVALEMGRIVKIWVGVPGKAGQTLPCQAVNPAAEALSIYRAPAEGKNGR